MFSPRLNEVIRVCLLTYCSWRVVRQLKRFLASPSSRLFHLPAPNGPACPRFLYHLPPCEDMRHSLDQQLIGNGEVSSPITARGNSIPVKISFKSKISFFFFMIGLVPKAVAASYTMLNWMCWWIYEDIFNWQFLKSITSDSVLKWTLWWPFPKWHYHLYLGTKLEHLLFAECKSDWHHRLLFPIVYQQ